MNDPNAAASNAIVSLVQFYTGVIEDMSKRYGMVTAQLATLDARAREMEQRIKDGSAENARLVGQLNENAKKDDVERAKLIDLYNDKLDAARSEIARLHADASRQGFTLSHPAREPF